MKINATCCYQSEELTEHLFGKELFIRFPVCVFRERLPRCVCPYSLLILRAGFLI